MFFVRGILKYVLKSSSLSLFIKKLDLEAPFYSDPPRAVFAPGKLEGAAMLLTPALSKTHLWNYIDKLSGQDVSTVPIGAVQTQGASWLQRLLLNTENGVKNKNPQRVKKGFDQRPKPSAGARRRPT